MYSVTVIRHLPDTAYNPRRIAGNHRVGRDIFRNYRSGSDYRPVSDGDTRQQYRTAAYPYTVAYRHWFSPLGTRVTLRRFNGMAGCVNAYARPYEHIATDTDFSLIENRKIEIGKEVLSYLNIATIVTPERRIDMEPLTHSTEQTCQDTPLTGIIVRPQAVELIYFRPCMFKPAQKLRVDSIIPLAGKHLAPFSFKFHTITDITSIVHSVQTLLLKH